MNLWNETKSVPISRPMVWEAYKKVRSNQGSAGVDQISMDEFETNRSKYLYKLWNRMASGSYFPPPVKEVEIPKKDGGANGVKGIFRTEVREDIQFTFVWLSTEQECPSGIGIGTGKLSENRLGNRLGYKGIL